LRAHGEDCDVLYWVELGVKLPEEGHRLEGRTIGKYTLKERVGEGGMGVVYRAEEEMPRREVAVKLIHPRLVGTDPGAAKQFMAEIEILGHIKDICIAHIYGGGIHIDSPERGGSSFPYFAMEFVRGAPIATYTRNRRLGIPKLLRLFLRVCEGIHHAHTHG